QSLVPAAYSQPVTRFAAAFKQNNQKPPPIVKMRFSTLSVAAMALGLANASLSVGKAVPSIVADVDIDDVIASESEICYDSTTTTKKPTGTGTGTGGPKPTQWTTSTLLSTKTYTVTKCPTTVHNCPAESIVVTTEVVSVGVTVCPVTDEPEPTFHTGTYGPGGKPPAVTAGPTYVGGTGAPVPTKTGTPVTAGAGRVAGSAVAVAAGLLAYLL
ncbi:hypothetical protein OQA88_7878, partial [Cercophora sp. LCS_1]